jgi:hypothetical protein
MKILMEAINYDKFKRQILGDLKVIALLLGLQQKFTKYCCFISEWASFLSPLAPIHFIFPYCYVPPATDKHDGTAVYILKRF